MSENQEKKIRHRQLKENDKWFIVCEEKGKKFETSWEWNRDDGHCIFCGEDAKRECAERKKIKEENYKRMSKDWEGENRRERKDKNLMEYFK